MDQTKKKKRPSLVGGGRESRESEREREKKYILISVCLKNAGKKIGIAHKGTC